MHLRVDSIEQALRNAGWTVESEGYRVAFAVAEDNLRLGRTVVADCGLSLPTLTRSSAASDPREHGNSIDFGKLDRYFSVITDCRFCGLISC